MATIKAPPIDFESSTNDNGKAAANVATYRAGGWADSHTAQTLTVPMRPILPSEGGQYSYPLSS